MNDRTLPCGRRLDGYLDAPASAGGRADADEGEEQGRADALPGGLARLAGAFYGRGGYIGRLFRV